MNEKMREEFEAWYLDRFCGGPERLKRCSNAPDVYYFTGVQSIWVAWHASRESLVIELPGPIGWDGYPGGELMKAVDVREAIEAVGLKVKP